MSYSSGTFGFGILGTDKFGWRREGFLLQASLISQELLKAFSQKPSNQMNPSATITIDDTDVSDYVIRFSITLTTDSSASMAIVEIEAQELDIAIYQSILTISINYSLSNGINFTAERFRGKIHNIEEIQTSEGKTLRITAYDMLYSLSENQPALNKAYMHWSAKTLINAELAYWGFSAFIGTFKDYTTSVWPSNFANSREFLFALANGRKKTLMFVAPSSQVILIDANDVPDSGWTIYKEGQTFQNFFYDSRTRYNRVPMTGPVIYTFNDTKDQAQKGIMPHPGINSSVIGNISDYIALGQSICDDSYLERVEFETPLNPCISPASKITLETKEGVYKTVRVDAVTDSGGWPGGFWSRFIGRVIP